MRQFWMYIMANRSRTLYIGVTNDIARRVWEHKHMQVEGFTRRYLIDRLVYYEPATKAGAAIAREKQLKGWVRRRKVALIESVNPTWRDLSLDFLDIRRTTPLPYLNAALNPSRRDSSLSMPADEATRKALQLAEHEEMRRAQNDGTEATG